MRQTKKLTFVHVEELDADVLELPYDNDALVMIVVVPKEGNDVMNVEKKLATFDVAKINDRLDQVSHFVNNFLMASFTVYFRSFQANIITIFTTNTCENVHPV